MKLLKRRHFTATFLRASRTERTESLSLLLNSSPTILLYWFFDVDEGNFFWTQCKLHQSILTILKGTFGIIIAVVFNVSVSLRLSLFLSSLPVCFVSSYVYVSTVSLSMSLSTSLSYTHIHKHINTHTCLHTCFSHSCSL